jgi:hypothetical protein
MPQQPYKGMIPILGWANWSAGIYFGRNLCPAGPLWKIRMTRGSIFSRVLTPNGLFDADAPNQVWYEKISHSISIQLKIALEVKFL